MPSRRSCEAKKSLDAAAELCDAFVVVPPQVSGVPEEQLLVFLYPGLPTTAELFILPDENSYGEHRKDSEEALETVNKRKRRNAKECAFQVVVLEAANTNFVTLLWRQV